MKNLGDPFIIFSSRNDTDEGCTLSLAISRRPLTAEAQVLSQAVRVVSVVGKVALGQVSLQSGAVSPVSVTLHLDPSPYSSTTGSI
jgi:hypothetical protein